MQRLTSIRFLIPALTLGILLSAAGLIFVSSYHDTHARIQADITRQIESRLQTIQSVAEHLLCNWNSTGTTTMRVTATRNTLPATPASARPAPSQP